MLLIRSRRSSIALSLGGGVGGRSSLRTIDCGSHGVLQGGFAFFFFLAMADVRCRPEVEKNMGVADCPTDRRRLSIRSCPSGGSCDSQSNMELLWSFTRKLATVMFGLAELHRDLVVILSCFMGLCVFWMGQLSKPVFDRLGCTCIFMVMVRM